MKQIALGGIMMLATGLTWSAGNIPDGMRRSEACQACHGADGISISEDIPNLAGQKIAYLKSQLTAFKSGDRKHDVMNPIAKQLTDADVENLAAFWNGLPVGGGQKDLVASAMTARHPQIQFPATFPQGYTNYYTQDDVGNQSVTRFYANAIAARAARAGKPLPSGSTIVVEGSRAKLDADGKPSVDASGRLIADGVTYYSAMEAREGLGKDLPELLRNGDWGYGLFNAQKVRGEKNNYAMCLGCHKSAVNDSFVFTLAKLKAAGAVP